ncbi:MAG: CvpA family protein [Pyrinomonadaceae bacterium]|nr:CvpA family protein [Pyrinomonadaceae bacterium]
MEVLNLIDLFLVLIVLASALFGWQRGLILGLLDLVRWIGSLLLALRFYQPAARWLGSVFGWQDVWALPAGFLLVAIVSGFLIHLLGYALLRRLPRSLHHGRLNRILGLIPGFINGLIFAAILSPLILAAPLPDGLREHSRDSALANRLASVTEELEAQLRPIFDEAIRQTLTMRTIRPDSGETVELPFKVTNPKPRPDLEAEMLQMVNRERVAAGLKPLEADPELLPVARAHSVDMFARGYFSHYTPEGLSPFDRIKEARVSFTIAGENLALAPTLTMAHTGLMNSPGHRANILRPQFGRVGIGIMDGGIRGLMVTQNFRN